ncbi:hypothetical protein ASF92_10185 [Pedobacter sp. Leaf176]|nr:hypothetical protein ASF92_10185 [Pedobacter sp. Leaf176]
MTFIRFANWKLKDTFFNFGVLILIKIFIRIFGILTFLYLLSFLAKASFHNQLDYYTTISCVYYLVFFVFLDNIIKVSPSFVLSDKLVKPLNFMKWIPFLMMVYLIYSSVVINYNVLSRIDFSTPAFLWSDIAPLVVIPNLSFIIITILIFFASAVLNANKKLKEENDLTI